MILLRACAKTSPQAPEETLPVNPHAVAVLEADALVRDPARGGPPIHPGSAPLPPFQGVDRSTARYVGSEVCQGCHLQAFEVWASSSHAHSMATLRHDQQEHNPSCLSCHYTGFGHPGAPMKNTLAKVGCGLSRSCLEPHSTASARVRNRQPLAQPVAATRSTTLQISSGRTTGWPFNTEVIPRISSAVC